MGTNRMWVLLLALVLVAPGVARADDLPNADQTGSVTVVDPNFGAFTAVKHVAVWSPTNASNPSTTWEVAGAHRYGRSWTPSER